MNLRSKIGSADKAVMGLENVFDNLFFNLRGEVKIDVIEFGKTWTHFHDSNLIVNSARSVMAYMIGATFHPHNPDTCDLPTAQLDDSRKISTIKLGTGGVVSGGDPEDPNDIRAPEETDTALLGAYVYTHNHYEGSPEFLPAPPADPAETSVKFTFHIERGEGNGPTGTTTYTEAGLFCYGTDGSDGAMFAEETFVALTKNSNRKFVFTWTILF